MKCINRSDFNYIELKNYNKDLSIGELEAKIIAWQDRNKTDEIPTQEQLFGTFFNSESTPEQEITFELESTSFKGMSLTDAKFLINDVLNQVVHLLDYVPNANSIEAFNEVMARIYLKDIPQVIKDKIQNNEDAIKIAVSKKLAIIRDKPDITNINYIDQYSLDENEENSKEEEVATGENYDDYRFLTRDNRFDMEPVLKKFLSRIQDRTKVEDDAGVTNYVFTKNMIGSHKILDLDVVYNKLKSELANLNNPSFEEMMEKLEEKKEFAPWYHSVVQAFKNAEKKKYDVTQLKNAFVATFSNAQINYITVDYKNNEVRVFDTDRTGKARSLVQIWQSDFKNTSLVTRNENNELIFDKQELQDFIDRYQQFFNKKETPVRQDGIDFLAELGVELSEPTLEFIGQRKSFNKLDYLGQWRTQGGYFREMYLKLRDVLESPPNTKILFEDFNPFYSNSSIMELAMLESNNLDTFLNSSTRDSNGNIIQNITPSRQINSRFNYLTETDNEGNNVNAVNIAEHSPFHNNPDRGFIDDQATTYSTWIDKFANDQKINLEIELFESFKERFKSYTNVKLPVQTPYQLELTKLALFSSTGYKKHRHFLHLVPAKSSNFVVKTDIEEFNVSLDDNGELLFDEAGDNIRVDDLLYRIYHSEINRIRKTGNLNLNNYESGKFYFFESLNKLLENEGLDAFTESNYGKIKSLMVDDLIQLINDKKLYWQKLGLISDKGKVRFLNNNKKATENAAQFVLANMSYQFNMYQSFIGDPAFFHKNDIEGTFDNIFKRLTKDQAPGKAIPYANGEGDTYVQIAVDDIKLDSKVLGNIRKYSGQQIANQYLGINVGDAIEYVTWQEHLHILKQTGAISTPLYTKLRTKLVAGEDLTAEELSKGLFQSMKPVHVSLTRKTLSGDSSEFVEQPNYIKSSAFPLLPQFTKGTNLDNLREFMEDKIVDNEGNEVKYVRVSAKSANKIGVANFFNITDGKGNIVSANEIAERFNEQENSIVLDRKNLRIQQEIPYKEDNRIIDASQPRKLSIALASMYGMNDVATAILDTYNEIYKLNSDDFRSEIFNEHGEVDLKKLDKLIVQEAGNRDWSTNDLKSLKVTINEEGNYEFYTPLFFNSNVKKVESLLNSLADKRILKASRNGKSYVLVPEIGITGYSNDTVYSEKYDPEKGLLPSYIDDKGNVIDGQILVPSIFKIDGKTVNMKDYAIERDGKFFMDTEMIPDELLKTFGFRIPTHFNFMQNFEIVGFLPEYMGNVVITHSDVIVQMGSDFDIDKLQLYFNNYTFDKAEQKFNKITKEDVDSFEDELKEKRILLRMLFKEKSDNETLKSQLYREIKELERTVLSYHENVLLENQMKIIGNKDVQSFIKEKNTTGELLQISEEITAKISKQRAAKGVNNNLLSDQLATDKFLEARSGAIGIGVFATLGTFIGTLSSLKSNGTQNLPYFKKSRGKVYIPTLNGKEGNSLMDDNSIDGRKKKIQIASYFLAASLDNQSDPILGKINANSQTFGIIEMAILHGFAERDITDFLTNDVIVEYVNELDKAAADNFIDDSFRKTLGTKFTEGKSEKTKDLINEFNTLAKYGQALRGIKSAINSDSKGLDPDFARNVKRQNDVKLLPKNSFMANADSLLGVFEDGKLIKPTTINGFATYYGLQLNNESWESLLPYNSVAVTGIIEDIAALNRSNELSTKNIQTIIRNLKHYYYSKAIESNSNFSIDDISYVQSEAFYNDLLQAKKQFPSLSIFKSDFINLEKGDNNEVPDITFNSNGTIGFDKDVVYNSFIELFQHTPTTELAKYLTLYSIINNPMQMANNFISHIPVEILKIYGVYDDIMGKNQNGTWFDPSVKSGNFVELFVRNNPNFAEQFTDGNIEDNPTIIDGDLIEFSYIENADDDSILPKYLSRFNETSKKWELFININENRYHKLNILGDSRKLKHEYHTVSKSAFAPNQKGVDEANLDSEAHHQILNIDNKRNKQAKQRTNPTANKKTFESSIYNDLTPDEAIEQLMKDLPDSPLSLVLSSLQGSISPFLSYKFANIDAQGYYENGEIVIKNNQDSIEGFSIVFTHELLHSVFDDYLNSDKKINFKSYVQLNGLRQSLVDKFKDNAAYKSVLAKFNEDRLEEGLNAEEELYYPLVNNQEFIAGVFTNSEFQDLLNDTEFKDNKSAFQRLVDIIVEFLNNFRTLSGDKVKEDSALKSAITSILKLQNNLDKTDGGIEIDQQTNQQINKQPIQQEEYVGKEYNLSDNKVIRLNSQQEDAVNKITKFLTDPFEENSKTFSLKGYAGTGKTTILEIIRKNVESKSLFSQIYNSSPTHRANSVMKQKGANNVFTLHSLFGLSPEIDLEEFDARNAKFVNKNIAKLDRGSILIIDESSMINNELYKFITEASERMNVKVLFVGDPAQLKPVKQSALSKAFTNTDGSVELTKVERTGNNPLLSESNNLRNNGKDFTYKSALNNSEEGIEFTDSMSEFLTKASSLFNSQEFQDNPLLIRMLAGTNAVVDQLNEVIRKGLWKENHTNEYNEGEIIMGYANWAVDYFTKQPKLHNGGDYKITSVKPAVRNIAGIDVEGYDIVFEDLINRGSQSVSSFIISKKTPIEKFNTIGAYFEQLRQDAMKAPKGSPQAANAWRRLSQFKDSFMTPIDIKYDGRTKIGVTFKYGYSHTIHKSQGGTYKYSFVHANSVDNSFRNDAELRNQLKYVAVTRAEHQAVVLSDKTNDEAPDATELVNENSTVTHANRIGIDPIIKMSPIEAHKKGIAQELADNGYIFTPSKQAFVKTVTNRSNSPQRNNNVFELEKQLGLRNEDGERKRYFQKDYRKTLQKTIDLNRKLVNYKASMTKIDGEPGDRRIYDAIKLTPKVKPNRSYSPTVKSKETTRAEKFFHKLEDDLKYLNERISETKDVKETTRLRNERDKVKKQLEEIAELEYSLSSITDVGEEQVQNAIDILDSKKISSSDLAYVHRVLRLWSVAPDQLLNEFEIADDESINTKRLDELKTKASKVLGHKWYETSKLLFNKIIKEDLGLDKTMEDLFDKEKDVSIVTSLFRDISMMDSSLIQAIDQYIRESNIRAENELNDVVTSIDDALDKLKNSPVFKEEGFNLFSQEYGEDNKKLGVKAGEKSGNLIGFVKPELKLQIDELKERRKDAERNGNNKLAHSLKKELAQFIIDNNVFLDYNELFDKETLEYKENNAYFEKLSNELGSKERAKRLIEDGKKTIERYKREKEAQLEYIQNSDSKLSNEDRMAIWEFKNDLFEYSKNPRSRSYKKIAGEDVYNDGYKAAKAATKKWHDKKFDKILNDEKAYEFYNFFVEKLNKFYKNAPDHVKRELSYNHLPDYPKDIMDDLMSGGLAAAGTGIHNKMLELITERGLGNISTQVTDRYDGRPESRLKFPVPLNQYATQNEKKRAIENKTYDLGDILKIVAKTSLAYKYKSDIEDKVRLGQLLYHRQIELQTKGGKIQYKADKNGNIEEMTTEQDQLKNKKAALDYGISKGLYNNKGRTGFSVGNKLYNSNEKLTVKEIDEKLDQLKNDMELGKIDEAKYLEESTYLKRYKNNLGGYVTDESSFGVLLRYMQLKGMAFNGFSAVTNLLFGTVSNITYAAGEEEFTMGEYRKAFSIMLNSSSSLMPGVLGGAAVGTFLLPGVGTITGATVGALLNVKPFTNTSKKIQNIMKRWNVLGEYNEANINAKNHNKERKGLFSLFDFYKLQRNSEYFVYGTTTIAKMLNIKMKDADGNIMKDDNGNDITLFDAIGEDGILDKNKFNEDQIKDWKEGRNYLGFKNKIDKVNKIIHGNYDSNSPILVKKSVYGRMLMQFRSWLPEGFAARFEGDTYDETLGRTRRGRWGLYKENGGRNIVKMLLKIGTLGLGDVDLRNLRTEVDPETGEVTDITDKTDIANFYKNLAELIMLTGVMSMGVMLKYLADDDDEEIQALANFLLNQFLRLNDDIMFYINPMSAENITKNIAPVVSLVSDAYKFGYYGTKLIFDDDVDEADYERFYYRTFKLLPGGSGFANIIRSQEQQFNFGR